MKFRKSSSSSPRMELLSRRTSGGRMSTLKRSRSFRASVKLMSKIRDHANIRMTAGFDPSSASKDRDPDALKGRNLDVLKESQDGERSSSPWKSSENTSSRIGDKTDDEVSSSPRRVSVLANDTDSREITRDLKSKLSLTDRIMGKGRKDVERPSTKNEDVKSPKVIRIFRKKHSAENSQEDTRGKDCGDKRMSCETYAHQPNKHVSYENPTFVLDSSLDSSISSFLFEAEEEENKEKQQQDCKNKRAASCERDVLTIVVDSNKAATNFYRKVNYDRDKNEDEKCLENEDLRSTFRPRCETDPLRHLCEKSSKNSQINAINGSRRIAESFGAFDHMRIKCSYHMEKISATSSQDQKFLDDVKICTSKSCKIRTVDNIANFWASKRGNSFRSKMATGRKRDAKETKDYERIGQERVLVSTSSRSSTPDQ